MKRQRLSHEEQQVRDIKIYNRLYVEREDIKNLISDYNLTSSRLYQIANEQEEIISDNKR